MRILLAAMPLVLFSLVVNGDPFFNSARAEAAPAPAHQLRLATLAPRQSGLGQAFQQLRKELKVPR